MTIKQTQIRREKEGRRKRGREGQREREKKREGTNNIHWDFKDNI